MLILVGCIRQKEEPFIGLDGCHLKGYFFLKMFVIQVHSRNSLHERFCARHIYANFRLKHSGQKLKNIFWICSRSSNLFEFNDVMAKIERIDIDARTWLDKIDTLHWSRHAFDQSIKYDHVTNNMTESFNSMLGDHKAKTFLQLLEFIRRMVMKRFQKRKEECLG
ncbi:hypothetical protein ACOSQ2_019605 [Xanthoceras sorbifolium]